MQCFQGQGGVNSIDGCGWSRVNQAEGVKDIIGVVGSQLPLGVALLSSSKPGPLGVGVGMERQGHDRAPSAMSSQVDLASAGELVGGTGFESSRRQQHGEGGIRINSSPQSGKEVGQASTRGRGNKAACGIHTAPYCS